MPKTARERLNEYFEESRETRHAIEELEKAARDNYDGSYAYACGLFSSILAEAISELPKARRAAMRDQLYEFAQKQKNESLLKIIKETA